MILLFQKFMIVSLEVKLFLQSLISSFKEYLVFVPIALHVCKHLFAPIYHLLFISFCLQLFISEAVFLSYSKLTLDAASAYDLIISIYLSTFFISYLIVLIDCSFDLDLITRVLSDFFVEASSFSISLTWF